MPKKPAGRAVVDYTPEVALFRNIVPFTNINNLDGNIWRAITRSQGVAMDAIATLQMHMKSKPYDIRARDANRADELKEEIDYYKGVFKNCQEGDGFLVYQDYIIEDFYMTPFGAGTEAVRYSDKRLYTFRAIDSATLFPSLNPLLPYYQYVPETGAPEPIYFDRTEMVRMWQSPRSELMRRGWQMTPVEKLYLALEMLNRGDRYYANLLLDTPEAGLLDLGDMSQESALQWIQSFRTLFQGVDGFKIPVIYEHTTPAKYIPFGRPPTDLLFDSTTYKYAQLLLAAFGLTPGDIGLRLSNGSLSSDLRDERHSKSTGFGNLKAHLIANCNALLPDYLEFWYVDVDDELLTSKGRARSANGVAFRNLVEGGILTPKEARQQLKADGLITVPLPEEVDAKDFEILKEINGTNDQLELQREKLSATNQGGTGLNAQRNVRGGKLESVQGKDPVPASQGGQGEIKRSEETSKLYNLLSREFLAIKERATEVRVNRLLKFAEKEFSTEKFDVTKSILDGEVHKSFEALRDFAEKDGWFKVQLDETEIGDILADTFERGLQDGAVTLRQYLYEEGILDNYEIPTDIQLRNEEIKDKLYKRAEKINDLINRGTAYYLSQLAFLSIADITPINFFQNNMSDMLETRANIVSDYENNLAYENGLLEQYKRVGLTKKMVVHNGSDAPCEECTTNIELGLVNVDHYYTDKFGNITKTGPFHTECHCTVRFDEREVLELKPEDYYKGE